MSSRQEKRKPGPPARYSERDRLFQERLRATNYATLPNLMVSVKPMQIPLKKFAGSVAVTRFPRSSTDQRSCPGPLVVALLLMVTYGCGSVGEMPSDAAMRTKFFANQADCIKLVQMSNKDNHVVVVKDTFTYLDTDSSWPRSDLGFSEQRWNEYREVFRKLGIDGGLSRREDYKSSVFLVVYGSGGVVGSSEKGLAYSEKPLSPIVQSLEKYPPGAADGRGHAIGFEPLTENWYMYREEY